MFRFLMIAVLVIMLFASAVPVYAQDDQPIDMLENTVVEDDGMAPVTKFFLGLILNNAQAVGVPVPESTLTPEMIDQVFASSANYVCGNVNPSCIHMILAQKCYVQPHAPPDYMGDHYFTAEIIRINPWMIGGGDMHGSGITNEYRFYVIDANSLPVSSYQLHYAPTTGGWAWQWSSWKFVTTSYQQESTVIFERWSGGGESGCP